jgi:hypothetical protein
LEEQFHANLLLKQRRSFRALRRHELRNDVGICKRVRCMLYQSAAARPPHDRGREEQESEDYAEW